MAAAAPRSYLFVPGDRPERFDKALAAGADAVIIDLEDAVAPERKSTARLAVQQWLTARHNIVLRINAAGTPWFDEDVALARQSGVAAVMLPKAEDVQAVEALASLRGSANEPGPAVIPLIETAAGYANVRALAAARGVQRLAFGAIDFQLDLGLQASFDELLPYRCEIVLASRLAQRLPPVDSPSVLIDDLVEVEREALAARRIGFGGKLCIHPRQVAGVNRSFSPSAADIEWATRVLQAAGASGGAAVALDGKMIDQPVILRAQAILSGLA